MKVENVPTWPSGQAKQKLLPRKRPEQNSEIFFAKIWKK
jgi:hypothetical protein